MMIAKNYKLRFAWIYYLIILNGELDTRQRNFSADDVSQADAEKNTA